MNKTRTLHRRIVVAFTKLALGSCIFFGILAAAAVEGIEEFLVDERLASVATWASPRHAAKLPVEMPTGLVFHHGEEIPPFLRGLPDGVHDFFVDNDEIHVLSGRDATGPYVVVDHESEYDKIELVVYSMIATGLLGFIALSLYFGRMVARGIVDPITTLATAVRNDDGQSPLPLLDNEDEMGDLARAFTARTQALKDFLDRERFFTGDVSHELRTPLTVIIGAAEIIQAQSQGQPALLAASERILRTAAEATECVSVLLLLARAPERISASEEDVGAIVRNEVAKHQPILEGKPVTMTCLIETNFTVRAPKELLATAIGNLIRNACLYTTQGSVIVRVHAGTVAIEDTGPGLPEFIRARLMKAPLSQEQIGSAGTGLGLSLVLRICEHLGAGVDVQYRAGGGTIISLDFPAILTKS